MVRYFEERRADWLLALVIFALLVFGLVMVSSASRPISIHFFDRPDVFFFRQLIFAAVGIAAWIGTQALDYHVWRRAGVWIWVVSLILLVLVLIPGLGAAYKGAHRWFEIGPLRIQPSELAKLGVVLFLAIFLEKRAAEVGDLRRGLAPALAIVGLPTALIVLQPDLGTATTLIATAIAVLFVAQIRLQHLLGILVGLAAAFAFLIKIAPYRAARILAFLNPEADPLGVAYHIRNALIALGSGGLLGVGFGESRQKHLYLPEAHTDSIFAIIGEELGFVRALLVIAGFVLVALLGFRTARRAPDLFGKFLATGITSWFTIQAVINIAGVSNLLPFTGVPLPFISYGGSSLITVLAAAGILLNISKYAK